MHRPTLAEQLRVDHARSDGLLTDIQHVLCAGALAEARFEELVKTLSRHMAVEALATVRSEYRSVMLAPVLEPGRGDQGLWLSPAIQSRTTG